MENLEQIMNSPSRHHLDEKALDKIFLEARTHHAWKETEIDDDTIKYIFDLMRWGPTSSNTCPARFVFVKSKEEKEKLISCLSEGNINQTRSAPVTAIVAYDLNFMQFLGELVPHTDAKKMFTEEKAIFDTAFRNGSLQGAYFIIAARAMGIDCGPMSGFKNKKVDEIFFKDTTWKSNFLINLGIGDESKLHPRAPRLDFEQACKII